jgi:biotin carboxyl carrier protein
MSSDRTLASPVDPGAVRIAIAPIFGHLEVPPVVLDRARAVGLRLDRLDPMHAVLVEGEDREGPRTPVIMLPPVPSGDSTPGLVRREVIVDGWRIEVEIESEARANLRERARRVHEATAHDGPTEVHASIPGRIVAVSVVAGDPVVAGQQILAIEAMKMENQLRAPRDGVVSRVTVGPGQTIEVGDLLVVLE